MLTTPCPGIRLIRTLRIIAPLPLARQRRGAGAVLLLPAGLHDFPAVGTAALPPLFVCLCPRLGRLDGAAIIAAGLEVVAFLRQVCVKIVENRLVDQVPAARRVFHPRGLEGASEIRVHSCTSRGRTDDEGSATEWRICRRGCRGR